VVPLLGPYFDATVPLVPVRQPGRGRKRRGADQGIAAAAARTAITAKDVRSVDRARSPRFGKVRE
jgi:hypothetical protein